MERAGASRSTSRRSTTIDVERWEIHRDAPDFDTLEPQARMFETGIKVIDLLTPYLQGGKIGLFGGAGVGKTVLITEMIRRVAPATTVACRCSPASASAPVRAPTCFIEMERVRACSTRPPSCFGQMDEPPGVRLRVALSALTMAEYFRDVQNQDVLLFVPNVIGRLISRSGNGHSVSIPITYPTSSAAPWASTTARSSCSTWLMLAAVAESIAARLTAFVPATCTR